MIPFQSNFYKVIKAQENEIKMKKNPTDKKRNICSFITVLFSPLVR